jgi:GntR family transcriptional repressor for pyruvate dehydrogenase complex
MARKPESTVELLFEKMLARIRSGQWPVGAPIPSERLLMKEFGVSRIPVRESLSMMRALGIIETHHGSSPTVQKMNSEILGQIFPLILSLEDEQTYEYVFEIRLALESRTAYLAALNRTKDDLQSLEKLLELVRDHIENDLEASAEADLAFHIQIAEATKNPLFPLILKLISSFVTYAQILSCKDNTVKRHRALELHQLIVEAIRDKDADGARIQMESHLRSSAN